MKRILVLDNYDSFTYNLVHYVEKVSLSKVDVFRNDGISLDKVGDYDKILLSPGPGLPSSAGILTDVIKKYAAEKSIFGVCLGQQAIAVVFGGSLVNLPDVYHGVASPVRVIKQDLLFNDVPEVFNAGRYHSWTVSRVGFPEVLEITAEDEAGNIMALRHKHYDVRSVQFHPESILTDFGQQIINNWVNA